MSALQGTPTTLVLPIRRDETHGELLERTRARFSNQSTHFNGKTFAFHYIRQNSYIYEFGMRALDTLKSMMGVGTRTSGRMLPETTAALASLQTQEVPVRVDGF
jgi:hypothetical protein